MIVNTQPNVYKEFQAPHIEWQQAMVRLGAQIVWSWADRRTVGILVPQRYSRAHKWHLHNRGVSFIPRTSYSPRTVKHGGIVLFSHPETDTASQGRDPGTTLRSLAAFQTKRQWRRYIGLGLYIFTKYTGE